MRGILGLAGALCACGALAQGDVGLINQLSGDVSYTSAGSTAKARAFMKVREGDRFSAGAGAQVRVVYFEGGRQETHSGPTSFTAGTRQSTVRSGAQPQVSQLPSGVPQKISQTPELIAIARLGSSGGMSGGRGASREQRLTPQQQAEVRQARQTYQDLRKNSAADGVTPELFLYSVLQDHLLYGDMKVVVDEMEKRQPGNPDVAAMRRYVNVKLEPQQALKH